MPAACQVCLQAPSLVVFERVVQAHVQLLLLLRLLLWCSCQAGPQRSQGAQQVVVAALVCDVEPQQLVLAAGGQAGGGGSRALRSAYHHRCAPNQHHAATPTPTRAATPTRARTQACTRGGHTPSASPQEGQLLLQLSW
jgi:hypothetical protein